MVQTSRSSSLLGLALSLRESVTAVLKAGDWVTMFATVCGFVCVFLYGVFEEDRCLLREGDARCWNESELSPASGAGLDPVALSGKDGRAGLGMRNIAKVMRGNWTSVGIIVANNIRRQDKSYPFLSLPQSW